MVDVVRLPGRQPACSAFVGPPLAGHDGADVEASAAEPVGEPSQAIPVPSYLRRQRFHGFRDAALLPEPGSLADLSVNDSILLKKRLMQHRLQEMIHQLESERPERITGVLASKINYLKELSTRP